MNQKQLRLKTPTALAVCAAALGVMPASAAIDPTFNPGDLILGVQSSSSTGTVLEINLGAPSLFKQAGSSFLVGNISGQLTSLYGGTWYDDPNVFFGISGARSSTAAAGGSPDSSGDFNSTLYASAARTGNGIFGSADSVAWTLATSQVSVGAASAIQIGNTFTGIDTDMNGIALVATSNPNDWSDINPVTGTSQGTSYGGSFVGGTQYRFDIGSFDTGSFGELTNVQGVVDLYRIARFANGTPPSDPGVGSFIGSFAIEQDGDVHFLVVPEPGSVAMLSLGLASLAGWRRRRHPHA